MLLKRHEMCLDSPDRHGSSSMSCPFRIPHKQTKFRSQQSSSKAGAEGNSGSSTERPQSSPEVLLGHKNSSSLNRMCSVTPHCSRFCAVQRGTAASSSPAPPTPSRLVPVLPSLRHSRTLPSQPWKRRSLAIG